MKKTILGVFVLAGCGFAQLPVGIGLKGGVPLTDLLSTAQGRFPYVASTGRWTLGPMLELRLPFGLGVEFDVLYKQFDYGQTITTPGARVDLSGKGNAWEFPLVAKYKFPGLLWRPYVEGGLASRRITGLKEIRLSSTPPSQPPVATSTGQPLILANKGSSGFVMGAGVEIKALLLRVSPEIRYTRWGARNFSDINGAIESNLNQMEFLVGFSF